MDSILISQQQFWEIDKNYSKACGIMEEARTLADKYAYDLCVRRAQEAFELLSKTVFSFMGCEYPREHDVSRALYQIIGLLQEYGITTQRAAQMVLRGKTLAVWRDLAFYGDERLNVTGLFGEDEARLALRWAAEMSTDCYLVKTKILDRIIKAQ